MYDETTGTTYRLGPAPPHHPGQHWYDEPPYESDPDDFLMGGQYGPAATIQVRLLLLKRYKSSDKKTILLKMQSININILFHSSFHDTKGREANQIPNKFSF